MLRQDDDTCGVARLDQRDRLIDVVKADAVADQRIQIERSGFEQPGELGNVERWACCSEIRAKVSSNCVTS